MLYGYVSLDDCGNVRIDGQADQLYAWAHRPGAHWPCSSLARCARVLVELDPDNGDLLDLAVYLPGERYAEDTDQVNMTADELTAWIDDCLLASPYAHIRGTGRGRHTQGAF